MNTQEPFGPQARSASVIIDACDILQAAMRLLFLAATGEALDREDQGAFTFAANMAASKIEEAVALLEEAAHAKREVAA